MDPVTGLNDNEIKLMLNAQIKVLKAFDLRIRSLEAAVKELSDNMEDMEDEIRRNKE